MSPSVKLGLLTLVSGAAAFPHYSHGHSKFHHKPSGTGYYGPGTGTGGYYPTGVYNGTGHAHPSGTGASVHPEDKTTTLLDTLTSTTTVVKTIYATRPTGAASAGAEDVSTGAGACGPATVYVTATNKVTVTVGASSSSSSSSAVVYVPASSAEAVSSAAPSSSVVASSYVAPSSYEAPSSSAEAAAPSSTSSAYVPGYAAASSSVVYELPSSSVVEETKPSVTISIPIKEVSSSAAAVYTSVAASSAAASSASATPSSSPSYSGTKRGLAYNDESLCSSFKEGSYGFSYNWAQTGSACAGGQFAPMMHKTTDSTAEAWLENVDKMYKAGSRIVMGFNEPDHPDQANLTPEQACTDWNSYMEPIAKKYSDVTILGPSVTNGAAPMGLDWLTRFHTACPDITYHAINLHFYDIPDGTDCENTVQRFKDHVSQAVSDFGKKAYVTEFGLNAGSASADQAAAFLKGTMSYMEGSDDVQGYAYFMVGTDASMNQLNSGAGLSTTGEVYNS